jgi:copper(I)-binding protein
MTMMRVFLFTAAVLAAFGMSTSGAPVAKAADRMAVERAWTRATPPSAKTASAYLVLRNVGSSDDRLLRIDSQVAETIEVHSMTMDGGIMRMRRLDAPLTVPAGGEVRLDPGGLHLMMMGLKTPLREGERIKLDLVFERAGRVAVEIPIARLGATEPPR